MGCCLLHKRPGGIGYFSEVEFFTTSIQRLSIWGYCVATGLRHDQLNHDLKKSPEDKHILLMEAAYNTGDKDIYYKLMQKADHVLKESKTIIDKLDEEPA